MVILTIGVLIYLLPLLLPVHGVVYWSEDYDPAKNCQNQSLILQIKNKPDPKLGHCEEETGDLSDVEVFQKCKLRLAKALGTICATTTVKESGDLLYCKNKALTICCFHKPICTRNWDTVNKNYPEKAKKYLADKEAWLNKEKRRGYETCYPLNSSLDASVCHKDCESFSSSEFAKQCKIDGGFFKCCIRSETHTVFSYYDETIKKNASVDVSEDKGIQQAGELFYLTNPAYGEADYRCLNPTSEKDPTKWGTYDPNFFEAAVTQRNLEQVPTYPFDKRFLNFADPEVLKLMVGDELEKNWKETYGFDHASYLDDSSKALLDCEKADKDSFAQDCRRKNGIFKCCMAEWNLRKFETVDRELNLSSYSAICTKDWRKCQIATNVHLCSYLEPFSGMVNLKFKTPLVNPLGGISIIEAESQRFISEKKDLRLGVRGTLCMMLDTCSEIGLFYTSTKDFMFAHDRDTFCKLEAEDITSSKVYESKEPVEKCKKRKNINIRVCPKKMFDKKKKRSNGYILFKEAMKKFWSGRKKKKSKSDKRKKRKRRKKKRE
ncbi:uncharacterized protein LOC111713794 [Eurytemora carolleeae]|uniref:uncharacterized protein LOC111713794 n=1 Tax=Eurytemora carolleeae TaxID=1294199 RepID=UPI000C777F80|nr:uncharacterized protein LOC111713794 [Eurytemora carolleeae]|eukprot:XP_023344500.1 uncharacterized protein LOC111713794 [Eurytemora affinis]